MRRVKLSDRGGINRPDQETKMSAGKINSTNSTFDFGITSIAASPELMAKLEEANTQKGHPIVVHPEAFAEQEPLTQRIQASKSVSYDPKDFHMAGIGSEIPGFGPQELAKLNSGVPIVFNGQQQAVEPVVGKFTANLAQERNPDFDRMIAKGAKQEANHIPAEIDLGNLSTQVGKLASRDQGMASGRA